MAEKNIELDSVEIAAAVFGNCDRNIRLLENDAHSLPQGQPVPALAAVHGLSLIDHSSLLRVEHTVAAKKQGGFSCSVASQHSNTLSGSDLERKPFQGRGIPAVGIAKVLQLQYDLFHVTSPAKRP